MSTVMNVDEARSDTYGNLRLCLTRREYGVMCMHNAKEWGFNRSENLALSKKNIFT